MTSIRLSLCSAASTLAFAASVQAQGFVRMEMIPIASTTLTTQQILAGETSGKPAGIAGQLRIPKAGTDKLPAIVLVHGSGGLSASADAWAKELNSIGLAVLVLELLRGPQHHQHGHRPVAARSSRHDGRRLPRARRAQPHPRIDPARIAVIGFSKGAVASVYSADQRFRKQFGGANEFAAHIGLYTPCNVAYRGDDKVTGKPIRFHHGIPDDWVPIGPCRDYAARLKQAGADVAMAEYPDSYHAYDNAAIVAPVKFPQAQTSRNCRAEEADGGQLVNSKTRQPYGLDDPCVERGTQVAYNEAAHKATVAAVKEFLAATFKLKE